MAKRRIEAPSPEKLAELDAAFRSETTLRPNPATAPIAQVAADSAATETTAARFDRIDAETLRDAKDKGLLIREIELGKIDVDHIMRDRSVIIQAELDELTSSISETGLRLPIEVNQGSDGTYVLISGYRRLLAFQKLAVMQPDQFGKIKALVRAPQDSADAFAAMVEENEIRANLSHYERGRIAVVAAEQGAFDSVEGAVNHMFRHASKAKRSKIRSFAELFECLGDMLKFPEDLSERRGLQIAGALRQGSEVSLRNALAEGTIATSADEWSILESALSSLTPKPQKAKLARPSKSKPVAGWLDDDTVRLSSGVTLTKGHDGKAHFIKIEGRGVDDEILHSTLQHLEYLLGKPD